jgi:glycosyl transferase family 25
VTRIPSFLINLDRDSDRLRHMQEEARRAGLELERVPAIYGLAMPDWLRPYFLDHAGAIASALKPGEVGCYASHLVVARRILDENLPFALVFEDDLVLPADLVPLLEAAIAAMPGGWDILRLSNPPKSATMALAPLPGNRQLVIYARVPNNTGAQLLSRAGAAKLLSPGRRTLAIDEHLRRPWLLKLETFGIVPAPIRSNIFDSSIDQIGDRGLGRESALAKARRRHYGRPSEWLAQVRWQLGHLGLRGWLGAIGQSLARSFAKRR